MYHLIFHIRESCYLKFNLVFERVFPNLWWLFIIALLNLRASETSLRMCARIAYSCILVLSRTFSVLKYFKVLISLGGAKLASELLFSTLFHTFRSCLALPLKDSLGAIYKVSCGEESLIWSSIIPRVKWNHNWPIDTCLPFVWWNVFFSLYQMVFYLVYNDGDLSPVKWKHYQPAFFFTGLQPSLWLQCSHEWYTGSDFRERSLLLWRNTPGRHLLMPCLTLFKALWA